VPPPIEGMSLKQLKVELDERSVTWRGVCFEKAELATALEKARLSPPPPPPSAPVRSPVSQTTGANAAATQPADIESQVAAMSLKDIKAELVRRCVSTAGFFEKSEFVASLVASRLADPMVGDDDDVVDGETQRMPKMDGGPSGADGSSGPSGGMPGGFGGMGGMPGGMGGMGGMPGFGGMGGMPGGMGGMPGFGGMGGMGGGMGDMLQKLMSNPKAMALFQKAQQNPKVMAALQDVQSSGFSPKIMQKYASDPELMSLLQEFQSVMS